MNSIQSMRASSVSKTVALIVLVLLGVLVYAIEANASCVTNECLKIAQNKADLQKMKYEAEKNSSYSTYSSSDYKAKSYPTYYASVSYSYDSYPSYNSYSSYPSYNSYNTYSSYPSYNSSYEYYNRDRGYPNDSYRTYQYYSSPYYSSYPSYNTYGSYSSYPSYGSYGGYGYSTYSNTGSRECIYGYNKYGSCANSWGESVTYASRQTQGSYTERGNVIISVDSPTKVRICDVRALPQPQCATQILTLTRTSYSREVDLRFQIKDSNGQWVDVDNHSFSISSTGAAEYYRYGVYPSGTWWELQWLR